MQNDDAAKHQRYDFEFELTFLLLLLIWQMKVRKSKNTMLPLGLFRLVSIYNSQQIQSLRALTVIFSVTYRLRDLVPTILMPAAYREKIRALMLFQSKV